MTNYSRIAALVLGVIKEYLKNLLAHWLSFCVMVLFVIYVCLTGTGLYVAKLRKGTEIKSYRKKNTTDFSEQIDNQKPILLFFQSEKVFTIKKNINFRSV